MELNTPKSNEINNVIYNQSIQSLNNKGEELTTNKQMNNIIWKN